MRPWEIPLMTVDEVAAFLVAIRQRRKDAEKREREQRQRRRGR